MDKDNLTHPNTSADRRTEFDTALQAYIRSYRAEQRQHRSRKGGRPAAKPLAKGWILGLGRA